MVYIKISVDLTNVYPLMTFNDLTINFHRLLIAQKNKYFAKAQITYKSTLNYKLKKEVNKSKNATLLCVASQILNKS